MSLSTPRPFRDNFALYLRTVASPFCGIGVILGDDRMDHEKHLPPHSRGATARIFTPADPHASSRRPSPFHNFSFLRDVSPPPSTTFAQKWPRLLREACTMNPVELQIMSMHDNETLLQVHQVFPLLVSSLCRKLRPPSYLSRIERSLRGYHKDPPPAHVHIAIFCIGGLREVARFSEIEDFDARRTAVNNWYASVSREPINSGSQSRRRLIGLGWRQSRQASLSAAEGSTDNTASASGSVSSRSGPGDSRDGWLRSSRSGGLVFNESLAAGPPMGPLPAEHGRLLLPDLPVLQQIWLPTAEALLLARRAVERRQDIKRNAQVMQELIREGITDADELFYGRAAHNIILEDELFV